MSGTLYETLKQDLSYIINSAANVKHIGKEDDFSGSNIKTVEHLINLLEENPKIGLAHMSTVSVASNINKNLMPAYFSEKDLYIGQDLESNIYFKTKSKAEQLLAKSIYDNLNISIFRLGNITWRETDGKFQVNNKENLFYNIIKFIIEIGKLPKSVINEKINISPVDCCSDAITEILLKNNIYNCYHIHNLNDFNFNDLVNLLNSLGYNISFVEDIDFNNSIKKIIKKNPMYLHVVEIFNSDKTFVSPIITNDYTKKCLDNIGYTWTNINNKYFKNGGLFNE